MKLIPTHTKTARAALGMTQAELARAAGVDENTIQFFESGRTVPREETLRRIQDALEQRGIIFHNGDKPGVTFDRSKAIIPS
jgi:transcriptional regulator with XRE-family HTH domain